MPVLSLLFWELLHSSKQSSPGGNINKLYYYILQINFLLGKYKIPNFQGSKGCKEPFPHWVQPWNSVPTQRIPAGLELTWAPPSPEPLTIIFKFPFFFARVGIKCWREEFRVWTQMFINSNLCHSTASNINNCWLFI